MSNEVGFKKNNDCFNYQTETLVELVKGGEVSALNHLFNVYEKKIVNFVRRHTANRDNVDDLVQETFLQAMLSIKNYEGKASFSTWILGIALNLVRNFHNRSPQYRYQFVNDQTLCALISEEYTPEQRAEQNDRLSVLQTQLDKLPHHTREIVMMATIDGMSYDEIASQLDVSVSSVKSRLFRARAQLREVLRPLI